MSSKVITFRVNEEVLKMAEWCYRFDEKELDEAIEKARLEMGVSKDAWKKGFIVAPVSFNEYLKSILVNKIGCMYTERINKHEKTV